jgi:poly [ADP-ribose] polymerase 1
MKMKNGVAIDPASKLADDAHVYQREDVLYTCVLGFTDIQNNKNSFFKIQVLQSDDLRQFWIFSSWGRTGTKIGDTKTQQCSSAQVAVVEFERLYRDKTGNKWNSGPEFVKKRGKYYPIDIDYEDDSKKRLMLEEKSKIPSKLPEQVQNLVRMIFDINLMNQMMVEFQLDLERMPLGRLSKKQLQEANETLKELSDLVARGAAEVEFVAMSNKFYTLVPHSFGMKQAPVIDTLEAIKQKIDMIESLLEIEIAYSMLQEDVDDELNPLDCRYDQLKAELAPLKHTSKEFKTIQEFVNNTHADTHNTYKLIVEDVFKVKREGEAARYKPFKKLHNRQLLWHGSRLTNFVGILKNGLRIAPPEAPATGYMFGKGVYFADSVSKSANYCFASPEFDAGLLLLSEVALGDTHDLTRSNYITQLPEGKHSTKGVGKTFPDPKMAQKGRDGVVVPLGKMIVDETIQTSLLYNEYIVYDPAQINVKYLLKMKFDHGK